MGLGATGEDDARCRRREYGEEEDFDKFQNRKVGSLREIISRIKIIQIESQKSRLQLPRTITCRGLKA